MIPRQRNQENKSKTASLSDQRKDGFVNRMNEFEVKKGWRGEKVRGYVLDSFSCLGILKKIRNKIQE